MAWIKIDRGLMDSYCFANANHLKIWIWMLLKANYKKTYANLKIGKGTTTIMVSRGQFLFGRMKAEEELGIDGSIVYRVLKKFEELSQIKIDANNQYSLITICNYDSYQNNNQDEEQPMNSQRTSSEQPIDSQCTTDVLPKNTSKEVLKKNKEDKEINIVFDIFWNLYDKKVGEKEKLKKKWESLNDNERQRAISHIPKYKESQPDKKFRKDPSTYLNNKSFNDEIIGQDIMQPNFKTVEPIINLPQREYWEIRYGHLAKTKDEFMKLVAEGKIEY